MIASPVILGVLAGGLWLSQWYRVGGSDMSVFVEASQQSLLNRFHTFYAWKGLTPVAAEALWQSRIQEEWPRIDLQRTSADIVINLEEAIL